MSVEPKQELEAIWKQIEDATLGQEPVKKAELERAIQGLTELLATHGQARVWYALGYAWYVHPDRRLSTIVQGKAESALLQCVSMDPHFAHAWLYLGHHHYDLADYTAAAGYFDRAEPSELPEFLRLKLEEMRISCSVRLSGISSSLSSFKRFAANADAHPIQDIHPEELHRTLRETLPGERLSESETDQLRRLFLRLDEKGGFRDWFGSLLS